MSKKMLGNIDAYLAAADNNNIPNINRGFSYHMKYLFEFFLCRKDIKIIFFINDSFTGRDNEPVIFFDAGYEKIYLYLAS